MANCQSQDVASLLVKVSQLSSDDDLPDLRDTELLAVVNNLLLLCGPEHHPHLRRILRATQRMLNERLAEEARNLLWRRNDIAPGRFARFFCWLSGADSREQQEVRKDAARFRRAIAREDAAEALYAIVLSHAPDGRSIRAAFDATTKDHRS